MVVLFSPLSEPIRGVLQGILSSLPGDYSDTDPGAIGAFSSAFSSAFNIFHSAKDFSSAFSNAFTNGNI